MKIAVMGAGGIGSYLGAMLARSGAEVTLVCRGRHLAAIREHGLSLSTPKESFRIPVAATDRAEGEQDVIIQAVTLYDLASSTQQMLLMVGARTVVLPIQNGVTAAEDVSAVVEGDRVLGGTVFINSHVVAPGEVVSKSEGNTVFLGELSGARSNRALALESVCRNAGIDARCASDIKAEQWRKFIPVAGLSALASLCRQPIGPILQDPSLKKLYQVAMREVAELAAAKGITLEPDIVERMLALAERYKYDARVSMLEDLEAGKPLELEWLSGYVSREAAKLGLPTPFHDMAYACLRSFNR
jgi:2-dehydropantoate 2-reductase